MNKELSNNIDLDYVKKIGKNVIVKSINMLNEGNNLDRRGYEEEKELISIAENKEYKKFLKYINEYLTSKYLIEILADLYNTKSSSFDTQSLKLNDILTDLYLIEKEIQYYSDKINELKEVEKTIMHEEEMKKAMAKIRVDLKEKDINISIEDKEFIINTFSKFEMQTEVNIEKLELKINLRNAYRKELARERKKASKIQNDPNFLGLMRITFKSFCEAKAILYLIDNICSRFEIKEKVILKPLSETASYKSTRAKIEKLLDISLSNNKYTANISHTNIYNYLIDYISLNEENKSLKYRQIEIQEKDFINYKLKELFDQVMKQISFYDIQMLMNNIIKHASNGLLKEMGWQ